MPRMFFYTKILIVCKVGGGVIDLLMFKPNGHKGPKDARNSRTGQLSSVPCSVLTTVFISRFFIINLDFKREFDKSKMLGFA